MISIIMGTYNGEAYLEEQLESIVTQSYTDWKLFLFDDGSTDATEKIAKKYEANYKDKIYFHKNPQNYGAKGNFFQGLRLLMERYHPDTEYIAFSDQDDVWDREKLALSLAFLKKIERKDLPSLVYSDVRITDRNLNLLSDSYLHAAKLKPNQNDFASLLMENKAIGGTVLMNRSAAKFQLAAENRLSTYPKQAKMHDWWFSLLASSFHQIAFLDLALESYRQHGSNVVGGESFFRYFKKRLGKIKEIRERIYENIEQAEEFLRFFSNVLTIETKDTLEDFIKLRKSSWLQKRRIILKRGFYKSGWIRNVALLILI